LDASKTPVLPVDIGVFGHRGDSTPRLYRTRRVPMDVDYLQPFIQLRLPKRAKGQITFEIIDDHGETLFFRAEKHELPRGRTLVVPSRRLPVHDALDMDEGNWTLRVRVGDTLLAEHSFGWIEGVDEFVAENIAEDGEISNELRAAMAESRLQKMSLDDLLAFQEPDPQQSNTSRG